VVSNNNVTTFIKELVLEPVNDSAFHFNPGEYVQLKVPPFALNFDQLPIDPPFDETWKNLGLKKYSAKNEFHTHRNYSLATNPEKERLLRFNIRIALPDGKNGFGAGVGSSYAFSLKPGDEVQLTGPYGNFHIKKSDREMIYLGGGAGMAPLRSHLSYLLETLKTKRKVSFWYGARTTDDLFYMEYFENLQKNHSNFSFKIALSEQEKLAAQNDYHIGFIHEVLLDQYLKKHTQPQEIEYYLCGPPPMIEASMKILERLGVRDEMVSFDEF
jgi:Na(+)-translocating NADH:ubiquinone oxidoreductase F subunit